MGGYIHDMPCTWQLSWLAVERPWLALAQPFLSFLTEYCSLIGGEVVQISEHPLTLKTSVSHVMDKISSFYSVRKTSRK